MEKQEKKNYQKTYTITLKLDLPVSFICDHCQKQNDFYQSKTFFKFYTVILKKVSPEDYNDENMQLPEEIKEQYLEKLHQECDFYLHQLKEEIQKENYSVLDTLSCMNCQKNQTWQSSFQYQLSVIYRFIISFIIIGFTMLLSFIFKNFITSFETVINISLFQFLFARPLLLGFLIGIFVALLYFIHHYKRITAHRYHTLNTETQNIPFVDFNHVKIETKIYPYRLENRLKK